MNMDLEEKKCATSEENDKLVDASFSPLIVDNVNNRENKEMDSFKCSEPELIKNNPSTIGHFRRMGIFVVNLRDGKYLTSNKMLLCLYFLWYLAAIVIFAAAFAIKEIFKDENFVDKVNNYLEAAIVGIFLGILPACAIYLMKEINTHLPQVLMATSKFEESNFYKEHLKKEEYLNESKVSYREGFRNEDHNDKEDDINIESGQAKSAKQMWWIVKHGPLVGFILSIGVITSLIILSVIMEIHRDNSLRRLKKELPPFIICVVYPVKSYISIWFCIFFLEWQRKIYSCIRRYIRKIRETDGVNIKTELEQVECSLKLVQKVFVLLNQKIFQKTIVMDFSLYIILGVYIICQLIETAHNFAYILPLGLIFGHLYIICKWSNDLMDEYKETIEVLDEMKDEDIEKFQLELQNSPPQVTSFGGFSANYSMMTAVIAFILSIVSITGMVWQDKTNTCYQYQDEIGINQTLCINDIIGTNIFRNGSLNLHLINDTAV